MTAPIAEFESELGEASGAWRALAPGCGLAMLALFVLLWRFDRPAYMGLLAVWGVPALGHPFADWQAVVGLAHCAAHGADVYVASRCGLFMYSPLWLWAGLIPPGPEWTAAVGISLDAIFILSFDLVFRPRNGREAAVFTLACLSSVTAFAAERANVDIILFVMIMLAAALAGGRPGQRILGYLVIIVAALLKFYPVVALAIALRERTARFAAIAATALAAMAAVLFVIRHDMTHLAAGIPGGRFGLDAFGASNVLYLLHGRGAPGVQWFAALALLGLGGLALGLTVARAAGLPRAMKTLAERDRAMLVAGAAVIVGCFFAGQSIAYRAIFLIPVVGGAIAMRRGAGEARLKARLGWLIAILLALMWSASAEAVFYPHSAPVPAILALIHELIWWWAIATLLGLLMIFAAQSQSLAFIKGAFMGRIRSGATG